MQDDAATAGTAVERDAGGDPGSGAMDAVERDGGAGRVSAPAATTAVPADPARPGAMRRLGLDALAYPAFRTFFGATLVSNTASFVLSAGLSWTVLVVSGSAASVGFVGFLYALPFALFTLHAGLLTDRFGARRMVAVATFGGGLLTLLLGALVLALTLPVLAIGLLAFSIGCLSVIGSPAGISIVNDLVPRAAMPSAVALIFLNVNAGRIVGGLVAGAMLAAFPSGITLLLAGVMMVPAGIAIWRLRIREAEVVAHGSRAMFRPLIEAGAYARRQPVLATVLLLAIVPGAIGLSFNYLLPVAAHQLDYGSDGLGLWIASAGVGGLVAGYLGARLMRLLGHGRAVLTGVTMIALGMIAFGLVSGLYAGAAAMVVAGAGFAVYASSSLSLVQALASAEYRGRLTAVFSLLYWGLMPIGALIAGAMAQAIGAQAAFVVSGTAVAIAGLTALVIRPALASARVLPDDATRATATASA
ncbi:MAG: MFS transporter [Chloroflexota bacterium]